MQRNISKADRKILAARAAQAALFVAFLGTWCAGLRQAGKVEHWRLLLPLGQGFAGEAAPCVLLPATDDIATQQVGKGAEVGIGLEVILSGGNTQRLFEGRFDLVEQTIDTNL